MRASKRELPMLLEITLEEAETVIPIVPTREQYLRYWNDSRTNTARILIAILVGLSMVIVSRLFGETTFLGLLFFLGGILALFYPFLWGPLFVISRRNLAYREIPYTALFFGQIQKTRRLESVIQEQEKIDENGDTYIEEVRARQLELEVGDEEGHAYRIRVEDEPRYRPLIKQQSVIAMVKAYSRDLNRRPVVSELYVVKLGEWVGEVSYLNRERFLELADELLAQEA